MKDLLKLRRVRGGYGMSIVSTPKGLMTNKEARKQKLGGEDNLPNLVKYINKYKNMSRIGKKLIEIPQGVTVDS